uniref:Uncharacterized protein n=2 Tax=Oryza sativa subsp. japonica TaxID=39947 RepID=Q10PP2_ORYSJ|nr:Hypothetical protein [Oryza sativa Japonica Group]ABF94751.1 retrotransposon protein, putative, Ty3-gypsy subclass [Oryza sativa Japonica Group]
MASLTDARREWGSGGEPRRRRGGRGGPWPHEPNGGDGASATTRDGVSVNFDTPQFVSDGGEDHLRVGARRCSEATPVSARVRASRAAADGGGDLFHDLPRRPQGVWARHATTPSPSRPAAIPLYAGPTS